jgi:hypothetical protein
MVDGLITGLDLVLNKPTDADSRSRLTLLMLLSDGY